MLPANTLKADERRLLKAFRALDGDGQRSLLDFAEFLASRGESATETPEYRFIPRPAEESVVAAIRRLSQSYAMLDRAHMLNDTSSLMTQHVMQGRAAAAVIDELEELFQRHYRRFQEEAGSA